MVVIEQHTETKLKEWGTSRGIRIPKSMCEYMHIDIDSELFMSAGRDDEGFFIALRPTKTSHRSFSSAPYVSMDQAFKNYEGAYKPTEADWGEEVGQEVVA